jgi:hypothetical protein
VPLRVPTPLTPLWPQLKVTYTQATRAVAPVTRQLSRVRGGYLPRRAVATVDESIASAGGRMWVARPEERVSRGIPPGEPPRHPKFREWAEVVVPRVALAELPAGRMLGEHRVVIDRRDRLIEEFGLYWGTRRWSEHRIFWHPFPEPPLEVGGLLGVLAGRGDLNYFHFLVEILPRLAFFEAPGVPTPEQWYVPLQHGFQREVLALAGFLPREGVIDADAAPHVRADRLLVPGLPDAFKRTPPWTIDFVRERLRPPDIELVPGRRIYVTRGHQRHNRIVTNETEVVEMLAGLGFEVVDPGAHSVADQIRMFAEAECIVGPHGAGLTNVLFASSGASIIEILAPDYVDAGFWKLASAIPGVAYRYLLGAGARPRPGREEVGVMSDITVDLSALERALEAAPVQLHPVASA